MWQKEQMLIMNTKQIKALAIISLIFGLTYLCGLGDAFKLGFYSSGVLGIVFFRVKSSACYDKVQSTKHLQLLLDLIKRLITFYQMDASKFENIWITQSFSTTFEIVKATHVPWSSD